MGYKMNCRWKYCVLWFLTVIFLTSCGMSIQQQVEKQLELGHRYLKEEKYEEAIVAFNKAIELDPKQETTYIELCEAYEKTGRIEMAIDLLEKGITKIESTLLGQRLDEMYLKMAETAFDKMDYQTAVEYYKKIKLENIQNQLKLAISYAQTGDIAKGFLYLERIQEKADKKEYEWAMDRIVRMCLEENFIGVEDVKINGKLFTESNIYDAIEAYPCDEGITEGIGEIGDEQVYDVWHWYKNSENRTSTTKFGQLKGEDRLDYVCFESELLGYSTGLEFFKDYVIDSPDLRAIQILEPENSVLEKTGFSENGIKYIMSEDSRTGFYNHKGLWEAYKTETWWLEYTHPNAKTVEISLEEVFVVLIFENDILVRVDYKC